VKEYGGYNQLVTKKAICPHFCPRYKPRKRKEEDEEDG